MTLRLALAADIPALSDLGRRAFVAKFGHLYNAENLAQFLEESHSEATVTAQLAH
ncbi:MAG: GNAT family N-acetyltransferase, partial [Novosphingobium sp. 35-62-5]